MVYCLHVLERQNPIESSRTESLKIYCARMDSFLQQHTFICVISGFCSGVYEVFALLGRYAALIGSYRRFGTACR